MTSTRILVLAGDGIGPEVTACGVTVLEAAARLAGISVELEEDLLGGCSCDIHGTFCRDEVVTKAKAPDAVLVGAVRRVFRTMTISARWALEGST